MKIATILFALVLPIAVSVACKKDDGTAPNPNNPAGRPTAGPTETAPAASAAASTVEKP
ncbi:MAG: hypothetical protein ACXWUG_03190 [Polyangiales bacterium]